MYRLWSINTRKKMVLAGLAEMISSVDIVFFGEVHEAPGIMEAELDTLITAFHRCPCLSMYMEMFNYEQQKLLDQYLLSQISWEILVEEYSRSREGFNLEAYRPLIDYAKQHRIRVIGVMPPREKASLIAHQGLEALEEDRFVDPRSLDYDIPCYREKFYSMIPRDGPMARLDKRRLLQAQAYKDETAAKIITQSFSQNPCNCRPRAVVYMGYGHLEHAGTVPHRVVKSLPADFLVITSRIAMPGEELGIIEELARDYCRIASIAVTSPLPSGRMSA